MIKIQNTKLKKGVPPKKVSSDMSYYFWSLGFRIWNLFVIWIL